jgi:hypothetical protein
MFILIETTKPQIILNFRQMWKCRLRIIICYRKNFFDKEFGIILCQLNRLNNHNCTPYILLIYLNVILENIFLLSHAQVYQVIFKEVLIVWF